jgi:hypothetical protein
MIGQWCCLNVTGINWMGRKLNFNMMVFIKASIFKVYGTRMIVSFWPLNLGKSFIYHTPSWEKIGKLSKHLTIGIFSM